MKKNILILGLITFTLNLFSQNVIFSDLDIKAIEKNEKELGSVKLENEFEEILGLNLYPYGSNYKLTQPYKYKRNNSDFRVSSECEYYFDSETNKLKYLDIKWRPQNDVDILDFQGYDKLLNEEISKKAKKKLGKKDKKNKNRLEQNKKNNKPVKPENPEINNQENKKENENITIKEDFETQIEKNKPKKGLWDGLF